MSYAEKLKLGFHLSTVSFILAHWNDGDAAGGAPGPGVYPGLSSPVLPFLDLFVDKQGPVLELCIMWYFMWIFERRLSVTHTLWLENIRFYERAFLTAISMLSVYYNLEFMCIDFTFIFSGLLGPTTLSLNTSTTPNSLLNALNSSVSPLQSPSSGTPSPTLWAPPLGNTSSATGQ